MRESRVYKLLPRELFQSAKKTYICTYLFEGQNMFYYCNYFGLEFDYWHIEETEGNYVLQEGQATKTKHEYKIDVYEGNLNDSWTHGLNKKWFDKRATAEELKNLSSDIYNYLKNHAHAGVKDVIWTIFKGHSETIARGNDKLKIDKKTKGGKVTPGNFVACTKRATNDYKDKTVVVYAVNRFQNPQIVRFFAGQEYNQELFALQEMLQFIWRSAIRENNGSRKDDGIHLYIPSERMRNLLNQWLNGEI